MSFVSSSWSRRFAYGSAVAVAVALAGSPMAPARGPTAVGRLRRLRRAPAAKGAPAGVPGARGPGQGRGPDFDAELQNGKRRPTRPGARRAKAS